jgi:5-methylthioribose kinase
LEALWQHYQKHKGFDIALALNFAGVEIVRRLVGLAQLPLELDLNKKTTLLAVARDLVISPEQTELWFIITPQTIPK